jgi:uncharacterized protein YdeI (YjbR/CyaY-like superfamily)
MKLDFGDVRNIVDMVNDRDWISICIIIGSIVIALCFGLKWLLLISFAVFYRGYLIHKKDIKINNLYENICKKINGIKKSLNSQSPIQPEDLQKWFPKENNDHLKICWERLQKERKIHWVEILGGNWVIKP